MNLFGIKTYFTASSNDQKGFVEWTKQTEIIDNHASIVIFQDP